MDVAHLRDFITIVDCGSFTRAASRLYVSQPTISQRLAHLETYLRVQLLVRGPRGVVPTPAGAALYRQAQRLVRDFDRLSDGVLHAPNEISGPVAVGLPTSVASRLAVPLFTWVQEHYPGIHLQLFESMSGYIQELLAFDRLDLAILFVDAAQALRPSELLLFTERLHLFGAAQAGVDIAGGPVDIAGLGDVELVTTGPRSSLRTLIDRGFARHGLSPCILADIESLPTLIGVVAQGRASTIVPLSCIGDPALVDTLGAVELTNPVLERCVVLREAAVGPSREAVAVVSHGVTQLVRQLHATGNWPGITLSA